MTTQTTRKFLLEAIELSRMNIRTGRGGPFGAVIVRNGTIVARGTNLVTSTNDPTAHAEVVAIREACHSLGTFKLDDCEIYASCEPCPMCLGAVYWARIRSVTFANARADAAGIGFDDEFFYKELSLPYADRRIPVNHMPMAEAQEVFLEWGKMENKIRY